MHKNLEKIKNLESRPLIIKNFINSKEIEIFQDLYRELPIEIDNKRQKIIKKKWTVNFYEEFQLRYIEKLKLIINDFEMDNPNSKENLESLGLFQESYRPVPLHVDTGFNFEKILYKQTLLPLSQKSETIIFKNRFYGCSTTFSIDPEELKSTGYNKRSSEHIYLYGGKRFDKFSHKTFLSHENIDNLKGLEIDLVYEWKLGDLLIFDRTALHCSSKNLNGKKLGFTTSTVKI